METKRFLSFAAVAAFAMFSFSSCGGDDPVDPAGGLTAVTLPEKSSVQKGESAPLLVTFEPAGQTATLTWTSSDESIATVDGNGKVTGIKKGTVDITATAGSLSSVCKFTVIDHNASKQGSNYYLISMEYYTANNLIDAGKVSKDYRVNEADRTWDVWEDAEGRFTFTGINEWIGKSFYGIGTGEQWMWYHMKVTDGTTWSGGGVSVVLDSQPIDFTDLDAHRDEYVFHMALKTTSAANILIRFEDGLHPKKGFVLGTEPVYNNTVAYDDIIGDFARDGQWQEIEIPFSKFPEGFYNTATIGGEEGVPDAVQYVFSLILGDEPDGTEIEMDAVFFYKPAK